MTYDLWAGTSLPLGSLDFQDLVMHALKEGRHGFLPRTPVFVITTVNLTPCDYSTSIGRVVQAESMKHINKCVVVSPSGLGTLATVWLLLLCELTPCCVPPKKVELWK